MNEIDPSKYEKFISKKTSPHTSKRYVYNLLSRTMIVIVILSVVAIIYKGNSFLKEKITTYFLKEEISFPQVKKIYDKYLGGLLPITKTTTDTTSVFEEKLNYSSVSLYYDGAKLSVSETYLVPSLEEGMVVFLGDKENYGKTAIVESLDGIRYWYGNLTTTSLKLYDYVEKGSLIGEVSKDLYLVFSKDDTYLKYEDYLK